ncbi:MAG: carboxymuconolactone decarboxylase family protein [Gammaproteobacteria bacterium]|nr:carboxymuconolactone decarboxylase family protein [Gammaproteobacteria bacterium]
MSDFKKVAWRDPKDPAHALLSAINKKYGMVPNVYAVMANSPTTLAALMEFGTTLDKGSLSPQIKEKIALVVSNENTCKYCVSAHTAVTAGLKMATDEVIDAQRGKSDDPREQAILNLAISLNSNHGHGDNSAVSAALQAGVSVEEILDILGQVVKNIMTNTMNGIARTKIDFPEVPLI